jgi:hypothetical protein
MTRRISRKHGMSTQLGRKSIDEVQEFARKHDLPVPDGYIASAEGGLSLMGDVHVIEVKVTGDPKLVTKLERKLPPSDESAPRVMKRKKFRIISIGKSLFSLS